MKWFAQPCFYHEYITTGCPDCGWMAEVEDDDFASADTRPKGGDGTKIAAPSVTSGAVPEGQTPSPSPSPAAGR